MAFLGLVALIVLFKVFDRWAQKPMYHDLVEFDGDNESATERWRLRYEENALAEAKARAGGK